MFGVLYEEMNLGVVPCVWKWAEIFVFVSVSLCFNALHVFRCFCVDKCAFECVKHLSVCMDMYVCFLHVQHTTLDLT